MSVALQSHPAGAWMPGLGAVEIKSAETGRVEAHTGVKRAMLPLAAKGKRDLPGSIALRPISPGITVPVSPTNA